jgi:hypothetical protein
VQYDVLTYEFKINWIRVFANHKGTTHMLNVLILIFDNVHFRKMCGFIDLFLNFNMYVSLSRCKSFFLKKNNVFVCFEVFKRFKINKFVCCFKCFLLKGESSFDSNGRYIFVIFMGGNG